MLDTDDLMMMTVAVGAGRAFRSIESPAAEVRTARVSQPPTNRQPSTRHPLSLRMET